MKLITTFMHANPPGDVTMVLESPIGGDASK